jgi:methyl-accepting chemotaxis protein
MLAVGAACVLATQIDANPSTIPMVIIGTLVLGCALSLGLAYPILSRLMFRSRLLDAVSRSQAVIEFTPDGKIITANDNFLAATGYPLSEIQGKHHSIFVGSDYKNSTDYQNFWRDLRSGDFRAGEFKRYTKNGSAIWILASYNPVLDSSGNTIKVVKFASDITAEVIAREEAKQRREQTKKDLALVINALAQKLQSLSDGHLGENIEQEFPSEYEKLRQDFESL